MKNFKKGVSVSPSTSSHASSLAGLDLDDAEDPNTRTESYCKSHFAATTRSIRAALTYGDLPWNQLPDILPPVGAQDSARAIDPYDGRLISVSDVIQAEIVCATFVAFCQRTRIRTKRSDSGPDYAAITHMPKICLLLKTIKHPEAVDVLLQAQITDADLPLSSHGARLAPTATQGWLRKFVSEQSRLFPRSWSSGEHAELEAYEPLPFYHIRELGRGSQGGVDLVEFAGSSRRLARKHWTDINPRARERLSREVAMLKRLDPQLHIITVVGSYTRGRQFGLLHAPVADCDLWHALCSPAEARRNIITDDELRLSLGCLSVALAHMHTNHVRHKDIKPANILISNGSFCFTDFGLSLDTTEFTNSITTGGQGTRRYRAPELSDEVNASGEIMEGRRAPADVFALGCILMEIWSVLVGWAVESGPSFSNLAPFYQSTTLITEWIQLVLACATDGSDAASSSQPWPELDERDEFWLHLCADMLRADPDERLSMPDVVLRLQAGPADFYCCTSCQAWVDDFEQAPGQTAPPRLMSGALTTSAIPPVEVAPSSSSSSSDSNASIHDPPWHTPTLTFTSPLSDRFTFPFALCHSWPATAQLFHEALHPRPHTATIISALAAGTFDLKTPDGAVIVRSMWTRLVRPGAEIRMELWPEGRVGEEEEEEEEEEQIPVTTPSAAGRQRRESGRGQGLLGAAETARGGAAAARARGVPAFIKWAAGGPVGGRGRGQAGRR